MIKITAVSYNNQAFPAPLSAVFGRDGGTLGRGDDNYFVLPDPKHLVSRTQASIKSDGARHSIINLSQANPILLNGEELDFEREYGLQAGDELQMGLYLLRAELHLTAVKENNAPVQAAHSDGHAIADNVPAAGAHEMPPSSREKADIAPSRASDVPGPAPAILSEKPTPQSVPDDAPLSAAKAQAPDSQALMQAFLNGAGIAHVTLTSGLTPEFMENIGKLMAAAIQGTFELVGSRALIKREVHADVTMVVVRNNNPLKFLSDSQTVLTQMLRKKMPGFMGPVEAMQDAYADLQAHQNGMTAGMHGVVDEMLKRFNPKALEKRMKTASFVDAVLPAQRKARMWDQFNDLFENINQEVRHDFQTHFGKAFLAAYEKELERAQNEAQDE